MAITHRGLFEAGQRAFIHVINYFGGFPRLRRLAGLPVPPRRWSQRGLEPEDVIKEIQRRHAACEPLAASRVPTALQYAGQRSFGSWKAAITAAGLDYQHIRLQRDYTDTQLLDILHGLARDRPQMTLSELRRHAIGTALRIRFGSLANAARRAGYEDWPVRRRHKE